MAARTRYERCYDYARAYVSPAWEGASAMSWAMLDEVASLHQRGAMTWAHAKASLSDLIQYVDHQHAVRLAVVDETITTGTTTRVYVIATTADAAQDVAEAQEGRSCDEVVAWGERFEVMFS